MYCWAVPWAFEAFFSVLKPTGLSFGATRLWATTTGVRTDHTTTKMSFPQKKKKRLQRCPVCLKLDEDGAHLLSKMQICETLLKGYEYGRRTYKTPVS
jgi:hypothetical protein